MHRRSPSGNGNTERRASVTPTTVSAVPRLFQPTKVGKIMLSHRVVLAPLTRYRADKAHVHTAMGVEYYEQRASIPGTLLITEATFVSPQASGYDNPPGIWNEEQVEAWRRVRVLTDVCI